MAKSPNLKQNIGPRDKFNTFWIMINLGGPRYWKVSHGIIEKSSPPVDGQGPVISFDETSDYRVNLSKGGSVSNAKKYFLTEKQEKCRIITGKKGTFYGTPIGRIEQHEHAIYPGAFYIDQLVELKNLAFDQDKIIGFKLESSDDHDFNIIVLYSLTVSGDLSQPEIALNPPDLELVIREDALGHGVTDNEPLLFEIDNILDTLVAGNSYPREEMVGSLPIKQIERLATSVLSLALLASIGLSGFQYYTTKQNEQLTIATTQQIANKKAETDKVLKDNLHAFSRLTSIDVQPFFLNSESVWNKLSVVANAKANRDTGVIKVRVPVMSIETIGSGGNISKLNKYEDVKSNLDRNFADVLTRNKITISVDNNAYEIEYNFKTLDNNFNSLVGRK